MFFSANDLIRFVRRNPRSYIAVHIKEYYHSTSLPSDGELRKYVKNVKAAILRRERFIRDNRGLSHYITKWARPWQVVESLASFSPPQGEYGVGVEIEMGFTGLTAARQVAQHLASWRHVALDYEGGNEPIEATFPPEVYSKYDSKSQASRYLKYLSANPSLVHRHSENSMVGIHVNVSKGGALPDPVRVRYLSNVLYDFLSEQDKRRYFGRSRPYSYARMGEGPFIEFKMFNSTTDWKTLRRYVDISVALAELAYGTAPVTTHSVRQALEKGYNKRSRKRSANVILTPAQQVQDNYSLAA